MHGHIDPFPLLNLVLILCIRVIGQRFELEVLSHVQWCHLVEITQDLILCYLGEVFAYPKVVELTPKFIPKVFLQPFVGNTTVSHASAGTNEDQ
jgi:hypothetical protein